MSLSSLPNRIVYVGDGSSATFSFPYYFFTQSDLKVYLYDTLTTEVENQVLNTNYTISGTTSNGLYLGGGSVVMASALVSTTQIVITRDPTQTQNFILQQNANIPSASLTQQLDYLTLLVQRQQDLNSSSVRLNDGMNASFNPVLPSNIQTASNCFLVVNSSGTGWDWAFNDGGFGPSGWPLIGNGSSSIATFQRLSLSGSGVVGTLPVANGGTNQTAFTAGQVVFASTSGQLAGLSFGGAGNVLISTGSSLPQWGGLVLGSGTVFSGVLPWANGGTGNSNFITYGNLYANSGGTFVATANGVAGQYLVANASAAPSYQSFTASSFTAIWPTNLGGTGNSNYVQYGVIYAGTNAQLATAPSSTSGLPLLAQGSSAPIFSAISLAGSAVTGTLPTTKGGSGSDGTNSSLLQFGVVVMSSQTQMTSIPNTPNAGYILTANANALPSWQAPSTVVQSGILSVVNGGTGIAGALTSGVAYFNGSTAMAATNVGGNAYPLVSAGGNAPSFVSPLVYENFLLNAGFDWWQALPTGSNLLNNLQGTVGYFADQWYAVNNTGSASIVAITKTNGVIGGSRNGLQIQVTTQATATQSGCLELWQVIENPTTMSLVTNSGNTFVNMGGMVKAVGQVTQVGIQLFSCSGEVKGMGSTLNSIGVQSSITGESLVTVNSNAFLSAFGQQAFTYLAGSSGVVALRIRATAAQSGFVYSNNAGFIIEQAGLYSGAGISLLGSAQLPWTRQGVTPTADFLSCQRFYEKSYNPTTLPGTATLVDVVHYGASFTGVARNMGFAVFKATKRAVPTMTYYSSQTGASGQLYDANNATNAPASDTSPGVSSGAAILNSNTTAGNIIRFHWTSDSRI